MVETLEGDILKKYFRNQYNCSLHIFTTISTWKSESHMLNRYLY